MSSSSSSGFLSGFGTASDSRINRILEEVYRQQMGIQQEMFDYYKQSQLPYEQDYYAASRHLVPQQAQYQQDEIARMRALMPHRQLASEDFFQKAYEGVDPQDWAERAAVDVGAQYAGSEAALRRDAMRMGVDPNSGRFAANQKGYGLNMAKDTAAMMTAARRAAKDENWRRSASAMQYAQQGG